MASCPSLTKKIPIGALQPGCNSAMIVAIIINRSTPRLIVSKNDGKERWVTTFTLRDSPVDIINLTVWSGKEDSSTLEDSFHIGDIVEVIRPKITQREASGKDLYNPCVTSWLQLIFLDGKTILAPHHGDRNQFMPLLRVPSKGSFGFLSVSDILSNPSLKGHYVDLMAAVRSVCPVKNFTDKDGNQGRTRSVREVRLFDQTGDGLIMKLWDQELIRLSSEWMPRENVLFLADIRIDYDSWRGCMLVTATGRTIITVNPDTTEAGALLNHAQVVSFSSMTRLDGYVSSLDLSHVTRVVNISMLQTLLKEKCTGQDPMLAVIVYGYLTRYDVDCPETIALHCSSCSELLKKSDDQYLICTNMECGEFNNSRYDRPAPCPRYNVKADLSDETGTLSSVKIFQNFLEKKLGSPAEFMRLTHETRTAYKWQLMLKPVKMTIAMRLPASDSGLFHLMLVDVRPTTFEEMSIKMPSPALV